MGRVVVRELFSSSGAFSKSQAEILRSVIQKKIDAGEEVELDFTGITRFTASFFNFSTGYFIIVLGVEEYDRRITLTGLSDFGESLYRSSYNNAVRKQRDP